MAPTSDEERDGVGFFRGLTAVVRGLAHGVGLVISLLGRGLARLTRRSKGHHATPD
jgi:hypothetical protein